MDNAIVPAIFGAAASLALLIFLWNTVLAVTKEKLKKSKLNHGRELN